MTFTENLESAKNGNRRSYGMLCNEYADNLYAVAIIVLDTGSDGETAVFNAFEDGFRKYHEIVNLLSLVTHQMERYPF